jgi:hypothetical protein
MMHTPGNLVVNLLVLDSPHRTSHASVCWAVMHTAVLGWLSLVACVSSADGLNSVRVSAAAARERAPAPWRSSVSRSAAFSTCCRSWRGPRSSRQPRCGSTGCSAPHGRLPQLVQGSSCILLPSLPPWCAWWAAGAWCGPAASASLASFTPCELHTLETMHNGSQALGARIAAEPDGALLAVQHFERHLALWRQAQPQPPFAQQPRRSPDKPAANRVQPLGNGSGGSAESSAQGSTAAAPSPAPSHAHNDTGSAAAAATSSASPASPASTPVSSGRSLSGRRVTDSCSSAGQPAVISVRASSSLMDDMETGWTSSRSMQVGLNNVEAQQGVDKLCYTCVKHQRFDRCWPSVAQQKRSLTEPSTAAGAAGAAAAQRRWRRGAGVGAVLPPEAGAPAVRLDRGQQGAWPDAAAAAHLHGALQRHHAKGRMMRCCFLILI